MKKILNFLKKKFVKNVIVVAFGTVIAQLITLSLLPLITRIYGPDAYGLMGVFMSILAVVIPVAALTLPIGIVLPKKSIEAIEIIKASIKISIIISLGSFIILLLFYKDIANILQIESVDILLFLIPLIILVSGADQIFRQWLIRNKEFITISKISVYQPLIIYGGMVIAGFLMPLASVLILFLSAKSLVSAFLMYLVMIKNKDKLFNKLKNQKTNFKVVIMKYRDFPMFRAPQELINATSQNLPVLILATFFGPAAAGFFSIGRTALSIPSQIIGKAVGDVFYPRISEAANNNENLTKLIKKATMILFIIGLIPFGTVMIFGPWLFTLVFGTEWTVAGEYARWLSIWLLFMFANKPCVKALPVLSAQGFHLKFTIASLLTRIIALFAGFYFYQSDLVAIALYGITGAILNILLIFITINFSNKFDMKKKG
ncbi:polysaccharide biosynthesis protein [Salipaludibacillus keqinensis]|uniref:Polysaccharide biosynthesis protein n=1 Tax=Salipaludibacillus keqinensis TaxID=2045207 RepID=A0A323TIT7_9BACI|nr:lipopolysaccharide biosynthesis protein [Salipaludibacillus keqinensis]PYZ92583.1 polysaccharide biosynthesis protein [Salipaludibacillus keqinensis]